MEQTNSFGIILNGDRSNSLLEHGTAEHFKQICFQLVYQIVATVSEDLIVIGSRFQIIVGAATEKARLPIFSLSFRNKKLFGNGLSKGQRKTAD